MVSPESFPRDQETSSYVLSSNMAAHVGVDRSVHMDTKRNVLKSWKEIAAYLGVGTRTAQRWKRERSLPVQQPGTEARGTVFALPEMIDQWLIEAATLRAKRNVEQPALADINITDNLWKRNSRPRQLERQVEALLDLARSMVSRSGTEILARIATYALRLCRAESSGFSILESAPDGDEIFRWTATCGRMQRFEGGTTPADFSPCGVCLERNSPQLFKHPEKLYTYLHPISPIAEVLLIPLYGESASLGTIWVICHAEKRRFDQEDARIMMELGTLASATLLKRQENPSSRAETHVNP